MPPFSLPSNVSDTMQRCGFWQPLADTIDSLNPTFHLGLAKYRQLYVTLPCRDLNRLICANQNNRTRAAPRDNKVTTLRAIRWGHDQAAANDWKQVS